MPTTCNHELASFAKSKIQRDRMDWICIHDYSPCVNEIFTWWMAQWLEFLSCCKLYMAAGLPRFVSKRHWIICILLQAHVSWLQVARNRLREDAPRSTLHWSGSFAAAASSLWCSFCCWVLRKIATPGAGSVGKPDRVWYHIYIFGLFHLCWTLKRRSCDCRVNTLPLLTSWYLRSRECERQIWQIRWSPQVFTKQCWAPGNKAWPSQKEDWGRQTRTPCICNYTI